MHAFHKWINTARPYLTDARTVAQTVMSVVPICVTIFAVGWWGIRSALDTQYVRRDQATMIAVNMNSRMDDFANKIDVVSTDVKVIKGQQDIILELLRSKARPVTASISSGSLAQPNPSLAQANQ